MRNALEFIVKILKSRTVWAFVALFVINGITGVRDLIPAAWLPLIDAILGLIGIYFRISPRQGFEK